MCAAPAARMLVSPPSKPVRRTSLPPSTSSDSSRGTVIFSGDAPAVVGHEPVARLAFDEQRVVAHVGLDPLDRGGAAFDDQRLRLADGDFQAGGATACRWSRTSRLAGLGAARPPGCGGRRCRRRRSAALRWRPSATVRQLFPLSYDTSGTNDRPAAGVPAARAVHIVRGSWGFLKRLPVSRRHFAGRDPCGAPCQTCDGRHTAQPPRIRAADSF